jgi:DNA-binding NarL/FixJ family response regulator
MIKIAVIEDNRFVREVLTLKLNEQADFTVCCSSADGCLDELREAAPHVLLLDVGLEGGDSLDLAERVVRELPKIRVIVMDLLPVHEDLVQFVNAGVSGFILKDASLGDLVTTIRSVASGRSILPPEMTSTLFSQIVEDSVLSGPAAVSEAADLTPREREVIGLIADGLSNKAIARNLHISPHTVKSHVRSVMDKLALHSRLQIAAFVHKSVDHDPEEG